MAVAAVPAVGPQQAAPRTFEQMLPPPPPPEPPFNPLAAVASVAVGAIGNAVNQGAKVVGLAGPATAPVVSPPPVVPVPANPIVAVASTVGGALGGAVGNAIGQGVRAAGLAGPAREPAAATAPQVPEPPANPIETVAGVVGSVVGQGVQALGLGGPARPAAPAGPTAAPEPPQNPLEAAVSVADDVLGGVFNPGAAIAAAADAAPRLPFGLPSPFGGLPLPGGLPAPVIGLPGLGGLPGLPSPGDVARELGNFGRDVQTNLDNLGRDVQQGLDTLGVVAGVGRHIVGGALETAGQGLQDFAGYVGDVTGISDTIDQLQTGWNAVADPREEIAGLNSDGDQVVLEITHEGKLTIPFPRLPALGIGGKAQYGSEILITQNGGADPNAPVPSDPSQVPPADSYTITFNRNLQSGGVADFKAGDFELGGELNLQTADTVTFEASTPEEAAQIAETLRDLALSDQLRDYGNVLTPPVTSLIPGPIGLLSGPLTALPDFLSNPAVDRGAPSNLGIPSLPEVFGLPAPGDLIADQFAPSEQQLQMLDDNVVSFSQRVGLQERTRLGGNLGVVGLEGRIDLTGDIVRTVEVPRDGQPGRLIYTAGGEVATSIKDRARYSFGPAGTPLSISPQSVAELTRDGVEIEVAYDLPAGVEIPSFRGRPVPEGQVFGDGLPPPDSVTLRGEVVRPTQVPNRVDRVDQERRGFEATVANPEQNLGPALEGLITGDPSALAEAGDDLTITTYEEQVRRDGVHVQPEFGIGSKDLGPDGNGPDGKGPKVNGEAKTSLIIEAGVDDVFSRQETTVTGTDLAGVPSIVAPPPIPGQQVVVPRAGVNVRETPAITAEELGALQHGEFVDPTGQPVDDATGREWIEVTGRDDQNREIDGWVATENLAPHPEGGADERGRINPDLAGGYETRTVAPGETLWDIAGRDGMRYQDLLELNREHLLDGGMVFPGDRLYVPTSPPG